MKEPVALQFDFGAEAAKFIKANRRKKVHRFTWTSAEKKLMPWQKY